MLFEPQLLPFPVMETPRLLLRRMKVEDAEEVFFLRSNPEVNKYSLRPLATEIKQAEEFIQLVESLLISNEGITWVMALKEAPERMIGNLGIWRFIKEHYRGELGYVLHPQYQGKGYMQEAFNEVIKYGFETLGLHSLEANVDPSNLPSIKLLERNNFIREAYFRENYFANGTFHDTAVYTRLANKFRSDIS
jgi:ribosomal-protein-alanine N-acetyltransferase